MFVNFTSIKEEDANESHCGRWVGPPVGGTVSGWVQHWWVTAVPPAAAGTAQARVVSKRL